MNIEYLEKYCDNLTEIAFNSYKKRNDEMGIYSLLMGKPRWKVEAFPDAGHNYNIVLNSIYKYAEKNPNLEVGKILEDVLMLCAHSLSTPAAYTLIMNYIFSHLENKKSKKLPFDFDAVKVMKKLKESINSYEKLSNNSMFLKQVEKTEQYYQENYQRKV